MWFCGFFDDLTMKNIKQNWCWHVPFMLLEQVLARWWHPLAFSEALDPLHRPIHAVSYHHIAMAIEMASFVGVFVDCCILHVAPAEAGAIRSK